MARPEKRMASADTDLWSARLKRVGPVALILLISASAYLNANHAELTFDDLVSGVIRDAGSTGVAGSLRRLFALPWQVDEQLAKLTFAFNFAVNRALNREPLNVTSFLVVNILIHAINGCLVYFLVRRLLGLVQPSLPPSILLPLAVAVLFAVHPLHAASVAYIVQRRGALASLFYLLGVLSYLRLRQGSPALRRSKRQRREQRGLLYSLRTRQGLFWLVILAACYWLAIKSKSMAVTLPLALLAVEFCLRAGDQLQLRRYSTHFIFAAVVCGLGGVGFLWSQGLFDPAGLRILPHGPGYLHGPWAQFLTESRAFAHYCKLLLLPLPKWMCVDHQFDLSRHLTDRLAFVAVAFHGLMLALAWYAARSGWTLAALGVLWFYVTLLPYAVVPQTELFVEYKTYLPSVGPALVLAEVGLWWRKRLPVLPGVACVVILAAALMATTLRRNAVYQDSVRFYADAVAKYPRHLRPRNNLADILTKQKRHAEAVEHYRASLELAPNNVNARYNLGNMLSALGRYDEAFREYELARGLAPGQIRTYINWANALSRLQRHAEAESILRNGLRAAGADEEPAELAKARFNLANELVRQDKNDEAVPEYRTATLLDPAHANAFYRLGVALDKLGRTDEAIQACSEALAIEPDHAGAREALGVLIKKASRAKAASAPAE